MKYMTLACWKYILASRINFKDIWVQLNNVAFSFRFKRKLSCREVNITWIAYAKIKERGKLRWVWRLHESNYDLSKYVYTISKYYQ